MLGFEFVKGDPTQYVMQYSGGQVVKEGPGAVVPVLRADHLGGGGADRRRWNTVSCSST